MTKPTYREKRAADGDAPTKRVDHAGVEAARQIRAALTPFHRKLTKWQARSVWISARVDMKNQPLADLRKQAQELLEEIQHVQQQLRELVAENPIMAASSKFADTQKAMHGIETAMYRVLGLTVEG
jgi:uncharacterized coiled-coil DUF342 family protein